MQDAYDIVNILFIDGKSGVNGLLHYKIHCLFKSHIFGKGHHILSVGHDIGRLFIVKLKDICNHLGFAGLQNSLVMTLIDHIHDVFLCHLIIQHMNVNSHRL